MGNASSKSTTDDSGTMKLKKMGPNGAVAGELAGLLKIDNPHNISTTQCIKHLDRIIELLPRHIEFMTSHTDDIIDMHEFGIMCAGIYHRYNLVEPNSFNFYTMPSNKSIIEDETKLLHHLKIIAGILRGSENPDLPRGEWEWKNLRDFLNRTGERMSYVTLTLSPDRHQLRENFSKISTYLLIRDDHYHKWGPTMRCIRWYIETLTKIIDMIQMNTLDSKDEANLDECILVPGCNLFGISKTDTDPMTTLLQLVTNAKELLRFKMSLIEIDWITRRQSLIPAARHASTSNLANAAKFMSPEERDKMIANAAKFMSDTFTLAERNEIIANSGLMRKLLMKLSRQRRFGGSRRRETKTKPKSRKNKHSTKLNSIFS